MSFKYTSRHHGCYAAQVPHRTTYVVLTLSLLIRPVWPSTYEELVSLSQKKNPGFPQKPQFGITASLIHSVPSRPSDLLFELHCARVLRAGRIQRTSQTFVALVVQSLTSCAACTFTGWVSKGSVRWQCRMSQVTACVSCPLHDVHPTFFLPPSPHCLAPRLVLPFVLCKDGCCRQRCWNTNFGPNSFFHQTPTPHICVVKMISDVGIILSHIYIHVRVDPPPPSAGVRSTPPPPYIVPPTLALHRRHVRKYAQFSSLLKKRVSQIYNHFL